MAAGLSGPAGSAADLGPGIPEPALRLLDWEQVLEGIARLSSCPLGEERVRGLRPEPGRAAAEEALRTADEMAGFLLRHDWVPPPIPDVRPALRRLRVPGAALGGEQLLGVAALLASSRRARADLRREPDQAPRLAALGGRLVRDRDLEDRLATALEEDGRVADAASRELRRLRAAVRSARTTVVRRLESFVRGLPERYRVADASVTIRSGRYCVPIRREGLSAAGGIVHDESATHRTVFVEPPPAIEPMNRLAEVQRAEVREVERILRELTDAARPRAGDLARTLATLAEADALQARARWALRHGGTRPELTDPGGTEEGRGLRLVAAHHPLLLAGEEPSVPFDLALDSGESVLLVSGPNAGGKTVLLKTVGVTCLLAQSGVVPPVGPGTRLPVFRDLHVVLGDEQSIAASLSTFSAQVAGLREAVDGAGPASLVLLDEVGGSTDPAEGGALAAEVLVCLAARAGLTVATTHLGSLKALAEEDTRVVNASLSFDPAALRPTFRLQRDRPGRSYALEIATRLGMPESLVKRARARLASAERRLEDLLARLEARDAELATLTAQTARRERRLAERESALAEAERRLARRGDELEARAKARLGRALAEAKRDTEREIERLREGFERAVAAAEETGEARRRARAAETAARSSLRRRERETRRETVSGQENPERSRAPAARPGPGVRVRSRSLGIAGTVVEHRGERVVLESDGIRVEVPAGDLEVAGDAGPPVRVDRPAPDVPHPETVARPEVDLRGLRVDEVRAPLQRALDAAIVADLPALRVIHGKATFALRDEVGRLLAADSRIAAFRPGGFEEGGSGVTVVEFTREGV
ncbi:MAG: Smr/MutS family protein [Gemmatimonadota bacterium]|nr:Smr/MutS family protein [Gemmatimonadota bacterium]